MGGRNDGEALWSLRYSICWLGRLVSLLPKTTSCAASGPGVQWFYSFASIQCEIWTNLSDEGALHAVKYLHAYSNRSTGV